MTQNWRRCLACGVGIASFNALFMSMEHGIFGLLFCIFVVLWMILEAVIPREWER